MLILNPKCFCLYTLGRKTKPMYSDHIKLKYLFSLQTIPTYRIRGSLVTPSKKAADNPTKTKEKPSYCNSNTAI